MEPAAFKAFLRELHQRLEDGDMTGDEAIAAVQSMFGHAEVHDITDMFRTALYALGRGDLGAYVMKAGMQFLGTAGIGVGFAVRPDLDTAELEAELRNGPVMRDAMVAVLAAGNLDVEFSPTGGLVVKGTVRDPESDVEQVVAEFNATFEQEFGPVAEPPTSGEGWSKWM